MASSFLKSQPMKRDPFLTLPPLPGGNEQYLHTIEAFLRFLNTDVARTRDELTDWTVEKYTASRTAVSAYIQALARLNLIERKAHRRLALTAHGIRLLEASSSEAKAIIVLEQLLPTYIAAIDILIWIAQSDAPLSLEAITQNLLQRFSQWSDGDQVLRRLYWLAALGCVQQTGSRRVYAITAFGREMIDRFATDALATDIDTGENRLLHQLRQAARHTQKPQQFETIVGDVLEYLGYHVTHIGGPGAPDLVARAALGPGSYTFTVDTKARHDGKLHDLDVLTLRSHAHSASADFIVVVAEHFAGEKIRQHALDNHVTLLPVAVVEQWLHSHQQTPLNLAAYRHIVSQPGLLSELPDQIVQQSAMQIRSFQLINRVVELFQRAHAVNSDIQWTADQVHSNLAMTFHQDRYSLQEVEQVILWLANPVVGAISDVSGGLVLSMSPTHIQRLLHNLANSLGNET